jgi:hypothetical protein
MPYKHNEPRRHKIPKAKYKVSNWRDYDRALQQRGSLTVWVTPEALEAWAPARPGSAADVLLGHRHRDRGHAAPSDGAAVAPD